MNDHKLPKVGKDYCPAIWGKGPEVKGVSFFVFHPQNFFEFFLQSVYVSYTLDTNLGLNLFG